MRVTIVGGGLVGLLSALALHDTGAQVQLLERGRLGQEASWAGGGILWPLYAWRYPPAIQRLAAHGVAAYSALAGRLQRETGIDVELTVSGMLILDAAERAAAEAWAAAAGRPAGWLTPAELRRREPALRVPEAGAIRLPDVAQLRNPRLIRALGTLLRQRGVTVREHTPVASLRAAGERIEAVRTPEGELAVGDALVIAAGAWSAGLAPPAARLQSRPVRGQMLLLQSAPQTLRHMLIHRGHYAIPRRDGGILFGSTMEAVGFDGRPTAAAGARLLASAQALLPALDAGRLRAQWAGLRPGSADDLPVVGRHPAAVNLWLNTGHLRNGVAMAPAAAELLVALMHGRPPRVDPAPYAPGAMESGTALPL